MSIHMSLESLWTVFICVTLMLIFFVPVGLSALFTCNSPFHFKNSLLSFELCLVFYFNNGLHLPPRVHLSFLSEKRKK